MHLISMVVQNQEWKCILKTHMDLGARLLILGTLFNLFDDWKICLAKRKIKNVLSLCNLLAHEINLFLWFVFVEFLLMLHASHVFPVPLIKLGCNYCWWKNCQTRMCRHQTSQWDYLWTPERRYDYFQDLDSKSLSWKRMYYPCVFGKPWTALTCFAYSYINDLVQWTI